MCTLLLRLRPGAPWPVVAGAVRDEFTERPWDPPGRHWAGRWSRLLGGRDRVAGGTWLAVDPDRPALAALLNGVRRPPLPGGAARPTRGTLALSILDGDVPTARSVADHDGFHLVRATLEQAEVWSWDGAELHHRLLPGGDHILVNGGVDAAADPLVPHFTPLLAELPDPSPTPGVPPDQAWGPWLGLMAGAGLPVDDQRALIVRKVIEGRTYGSTSASLLALSPGAVRYDFTAAPGTLDGWSEVPTR